MAFNPDPSVYAATPIPTLEEFKDLWGIWDLVTRGMVRDEELMEKPIKLRNAIIFYLGHIPVFLDIQLGKTTEETLCEPSYYPRIFERGIDPDVDDPETCHWHSEVPDAWPAVEEILAYQDQFRNKVGKIYKHGNIPRSVGRALWIGFEHEVMHLETILYMLLQSDKTLPPTAKIPDFEQDAKLAEAARVPNELFRIPEQTITIGLEDPECNTTDGHFGWDNEKPSRTVRVPSFEITGRPITNEEYARYLEHTKRSTMPVSWASQSSKTDQACPKSNGHVNGNNSCGLSNGYEKSVAKPANAYLEGKAVRTVYGLVPLKYALDWPVFASYDELAACAKWMGGRIPTFEEVKSVYAYANGLEEAERKLSGTIPAVNGHLINDGVEEDPPCCASQCVGSSQELFINLENTNVGFKHWHPTAVTGNSNKLAGQGKMGGVWEWTSSPLEKHAGFEPMPMYPSYTADFFDSKHNIVLGGSWATHPRIAGRKSFVNWYQRNYAYAWVGARLARDL